MTNISRSYGLSNPLQEVQPLPVVATRAPTSNDKRYPIGQIWCDTSVPQVYIKSAQPGTWTLAGPGASDVDTLTGDSGGAISPAAGNITLAGGTNIATAGAGSTITFNLDAAISLATSVTSPIYTTSAADMNINSAANQDIIMQMGDAAAANKISFEDSASVEVASLDSDGTLTVVNLDGIIGATTPAAGTFTTLVASTSVQSPIYTTGAAADTNINSAAGQDIILQMGDAAGANKISFEDNASAEVASLDSNGNLTALGFFTSATAAGANLVGATLTADGTDANIPLTFVPKGTGDSLFTAGDINASAGDIIASRSSAAGEVTVEVTNSDNTSGDSDAFFEAAVGGTSGGNAGIRFQISGGQNYAIGIDNADSDKLVFCADNDLGTDVLAKMDETTKDVEVTQGNLILAAAAKQIQMNGGAVTDFIGQATLAMGTVTVANTNIAATDRVFVTRSDINGSTALGVFEVVITASTNFVINARNPTDATVQTNDISIVDYVIIRQN